MHSKEEKPRRKYEKPAVVRLTAPTAADGGALSCQSGSSASNCFTTGNSAVFMCAAGSLAGI